jgi:hypothetical protein
MPSVSPIGKVDATTTRRDWTLAHRSFLRRDLYRGDRFCGLTALATRKFTRICSLVRASARWHTPVSATNLWFN